MNIYNLLSSRKKNTEIEKPILSEDNRNIKFQNLLSNIKFENNNITNNLLILNNNKNKFTKIYYNNEKLKSNYKLDNKPITDINIRKIRNKTLKDNNFKKILNNITHNVIYINQKNDTL